MSDLLTPFRPPPSTLTTSCDSKTNGNKILIGVILPGLNLHHISLLQLLLLQLQDSITTGFIHF
ncbi:hypothetical protein INR49_005026 [Caranx melampygus]|nr:hypothetical protein INR49_005026 [Caranx melampygus]